MTNSCIRLKLTLSVTSLAISSIFLSPLQAMPAGVQPCYDFGGQIGVQCDVNPGLNADAKSKPDAIKTADQAQSLVEITSLQQENERYIFTISGLSVILIVITALVIFWALKTHRITIPMIATFLRGIAFPGRWRMRLSLRVEDVSNNIVELEAMMLFGASEDDEIVCFDVQGATDLSGDPSIQSECRSNLVNTNPFLGSVTPAHYDTFSEASHPLDELYLSCTDE